MTSSLKAISVFAKLNIGLLKERDISSVVLSELSSVKSSEPLADGFLGSKNPDGFFNEAIYSRFNMASSAIYKPGESPDLGSSDILTAIVFILSISIP